MMLMRSTLACLTSILMSTAALAQSGGSYAVPRTPDGHPDFQGIWATDFLAPFERPPGVEGLVASPEAARALVDAIRGSLPDLIDPDVHTYDLGELSKVRGEYRTSIVVEPADGQMPFTAVGEALAGRIAARNETLFDHPEQRPLAERCMENLGYPPMRTLPVVLPRQIFQTGDHVVIYSEDAVGVRVVRLRGVPPDAALRSVEGYASGRWEGDTLVIRTTHLRADDPARNVLGRPLLLSRQSVVTERFTRVSDTELVYRFTVEDPTLYTEPWTGEFSMVRHDGPVYEYACHEGNYSMPTVLVGGQMQAAARAAAAATRD